MEGGGEYILPSSLLQRIPDEFPQNSQFKRLHGHWAQRSLEVVVMSRKFKYSHSRNRQRRYEFFKSYRACVLTLRNAPEWPALSKRLDLSLNELTLSTFGDIFRGEIRNSVTR